MEKKTFRDELAMSLPFEGITKILNEDAVKSISEKYNIDVDLDDEMSMIEFTLKYQAVMRYKYADIMLKQRVTEVNIKKPRKYNSPKNN